MATTTRYNKEVDTLNPRTDYTSRAATDPTTRTDYNTRSDYTTRTDYGTENLSWYNRIRQNHAFQTAMRVFQFLSSTISLGLFSSRLRKILKFTGRASASNGAVEGILAAATFYSVLTTIGKFISKRGGPSWVRWLLILLDIAFVGAFIAVAYLSSPGGGKSSGPCHYVRGIRLEPKGSNCNLPWGTFVLAIVST